MQDILEKLLGEVTYHVGKVVSDPQTWSETSVHGGGHVGGQHGGSVSISSSSTTWTSFVIKKDNEKEYMAKLPYAFPARKGHVVKTADFRGATIAALNEITDEASGTINTVKDKLHEPAFKEQGLKKGVRVLLNSALGVVIGFLLIGLFLTLGVGGGYLYVLGAIGVAVLLLYLVNAAPIKREKLVNFLDAELPKRALSKMKAL